MKSNSTKSPRYVGEARDLKLVLFGLLMVATPAAAFAVLAKETLVSRLGAVAVPEIIMALILLFFTSVSLWHLATSHWISVDSTRARVALMSGLVRVGRVHSNSITVIRHRSWVVKSVKARGAISHRVEIVGDGIDFAVLRRGNGRQADLIIDELQRCFPWASVVLHGSSANGSEIGPKSDVPPT